MLLRSVTIENFRGFEKIEVDFEETTVLIGENNTGKTSFLEALSLCLKRNLSRRSNVFDDYDYHLPSSDSEPGQAGILQITLDFAEGCVDEWSPELIQTLGDTVVLDDDGERYHVKLRVKSFFDAVENDFVNEWEFLDTNEEPLTKTRAQKFLLDLQRLQPFFYLSAIRDAIKEFHPRGAFWSPFLKNISIPEKVRKDIEAQLEELNHNLLEAHTTLQSVKTHLEKAQDVVSLSSFDAVGIDALPAKIFDLLSKAQVSIKGTTGAKLPLERHGAGTQSLSVVFLFEAFLSTLLNQKYDKLSTPILALEEPEAHLHPCAIRSLWQALDSIKGQKIIATHSGDLIAQVPFDKIRRFCRSGNKIVVRKLGDTTLSEDELRKLNFHVRSSRGELLFARCWLLVEGETEFWLLSEIANLLGVDFERLGVRIITQRSTAAVSPFIKLADDFGISWFCLTDGDDQGKADVKNALLLLGERSKDNHLIHLPSKNIETFLCEKGFNEPYLNHVSKMKADTITAPNNSKKYWEQVIKAQDKTPKGAVVLEVCKLMREKGVKSIPSILKNTITRVEKLVRTNAKS